MTKKTKYQSVLSFYSINFKGIADMDYESVWDNYINPAYKFNDFKYISCREIIYFNCSDTFLSNLLHDGTDGDLGNILEIVKNQLKNNRSNFMFLQPINGKPIDGFYIKNFINRVIL